MRNIVVSVQDLGEIWEEKMSLKSQPLSPFFTKNIRQRMQNYAEQQMQNDEVRSPGLYRLSWVY